MNLKDEYSRNGLVVVKSFFSPQEIDAVRKEAKDIFALQIRKNGIEFDPASESSFEKALYTLFRQNYNAFLGSARAAQQMLSLFTLTCNDKILDLLSTLGLSKPVLCVKPILYFNSPHLAKKEGHYKTPAHQDWRSMQGSLNSIVIWIPLIDMTKEIGAVEFIRGSHLNGLAESQPDEWYRHIESKNLEESAFFAAEVQKGDLVAFSAFTIHRSGNNVTDRIRWSMHVRFNDLLEATYADRNFAHPYKVYIPEDGLITPGFPSASQVQSVFA
jgi:phytanoyl-CoA hydroxylase